MILLNFTVERYRFEYDVKVFFQGKEIADASHIDLDRAMEVIGKHIKELVDQHEQ